MYGFGVWGLGQGSVYGWFRAAERIIGMIIGMCIGIGDYLRIITLRGLRVQVPSNHILIQNLYYNYYYQSPQYPSIGYMDPTGYKDPVNPCPGWCFGRAVYESFAPNMAEPSRPELLSAEFWSLRFRLGTAPPPPPSNSLY